MILQIKWKIEHELKLFYLRKRFGNLIHKDCDFGKNVELIGCAFDEGAKAAHDASIRYSRVGRYTSIGRYTKITHTDIGAFCAISWDATINAVHHPYKNLTLSAFPYFPHAGGFVTKMAYVYDRVTIKNDVWVGANSVIMPGVTIGNGAIIGANAVVTKNIPDYGIAVGVPAKVIKLRFESDMVEKLLELKWWNLKREIIKANIHLFQSELNKDKLKILEKICHS